VSDGQPDTIIGISFGDVYRSQEFLTAVTRMNANGHLKLLDAVMVTKDDDGKTRVRETVDLQPGRAALSGAVWTGLLGLIVGGPVGWIAGIGVGAGAGAITAKVVDVGVPDEWVDWFKEAVEPHSFTVVVLASEVDIDALVNEAGRFDGGHLVYANLAAYMIERLETAMGTLTDVRHADPADSAEHADRTDRTGRAEQVDWSPPSPG
jgi:uncharacterized membrane protein